METPRRKWDGLAHAWLGLSPPAAPSHNDLASCRALLRASLAESDARGVAVLGSTPALRAMLGKPEFASLHVYCVDVSLEMYGLSTGLAGPEHVGEKLIQCDWLEFSLTEPLAAVLGDKVFDNVPVAQWDQFIAQVHAGLGPGGSLITRVGLLNRELEGCAPGDLLVKWAQTLESGECSGQEAASGFWEQLLGASTFRGSRETQSVSRFAAEMSALTPKSAAEAGILRAFTPMLASMDSKWTAYGMPELIAQTHSRFCLTAYAESNDYAAAARQPTLRLTAHAQVAPSRPP